MKQRIITGVIAGGAFLGMLIAGGYYYAALILIMAIIGYYEYIRMFGLQNFRITSIIGLLLLLWLAIPWEMDAFSLGIELKMDAVLWMAMFILLTITVTSKNKFVIDQAAAVFLGAVYIGFGFHYMISTRLLETGGLFYTFLLFICIWSTDAGAYFVGSKFGKTPLWPTISPKKSIEGAVGGIIISVIAALCFAWFNPELLSYGKAVGIGVIIGIIGQLGDLIQSAYKRVKGIKDTGTILPGHGGVLDRVDSWLIVFPFIHWIGILMQ
ncbi:phosphatidate cytidylyltransferase [Paenibacillus sp. N1-5-1-14]|uniref:phosphatidate cytidylyltransferase n=1 Tax=Paenibacillus radicibacter TaxID=2972488 RepID=UPI0021599B9C|nr:phosphatidate cytidylyltransferase [Paenibacillus radicibacter]MCR8642156.1 phosphatidate cytidylyltransferase [Paenibacillus radicibacter]